MTAQLIGQRSQLPTYDRRSGRYRSSDGRYVSRATILNLVDSETARMETRMRAHARLLVQGKLDVAQFQRRMADDLKLSHLRLAMLAAGGRSLTTSQHYGLVGRQLREQHEYLANFGQDLVAGKLTPKQALTRAAMYGGSSRVAFHAGEKLTRGREGFVEAIRFLDAGAKHCDPCILHSTNGEWVPIDAIVPPGSRCSCFYFCRCRVNYRRVARSGRSR